MIGTQSLTEKKKTNCSRAKCMQPNSEERFLLSNDHVRTRTFAVTTLPKEL